MRQIGLITERLAQSDIVRVRIIAKQLKVQEIVEDVSRNDLESMMNVEDYSLACDHPLI